MPFPWKKMKKSTRLSQMLSDQISQRRKGGGSPLVVETGFPTSLVDLFVKNKERLKRPSKKNNNKPCIPPPSSPPPPPLDSVDDDDDSLLCPSSDSLPLTLSSSPSSSPFHLHHHHHARDAPRAMIDGGEREVHDEGVDANGVVVAILRMFLVVVLVLGTKKIVVGITMSAFLLVFLEYVGKHACKLLGPCTGVKEKMRLMMKCRKANVEAHNEIQQEESSLPSCSGLKKQDQDQGMSNPTREIECCLVPRNEEIECEKERIDDGINAKFGEGKEGQDMDSEKVVVQELRTRKSRRARLKLKMKELVPKRLRSSGKKGREVENGVSSVAADNVATSAEEEEDPNGDLREYRCDSDWSSVSREMDDRKDIIDASYGCDQLVEGNLVDTTITLEEEETETEKNSGYVGLVLIVLVGLIGGRILALVLTLTWCLMQKSGGTLRQYIRAPFLRSHVKESG